MIPVVGAVIGGGFDFTETRIIGARAFQEFMEGNFDIKTDEPIVIDDDVIIE